LAAGKGFFRSYAEQTRNPVNCLVMVAPLFIIYQVGILFTHGWRNGADFVTPLLLDLVGGDRVYYSMINLAVLGLFAGFFFFLRERRTLAPKTVGLVLVEASIYAFIMGGVAARILFAVGLSPPMQVLQAGPGHAPPAGVLDSVVLSIGAGAYEELFFRLMLLGGALWVLKRTGLKPWAGALIAVGATSLLFSVFHYVPFGMEPWQLWSFSFRLVLGALLAILYMGRGFAVAVYTHAMYDIFILVPGALGFD
jgi:hypothetical protein